MQRLRNRLVSELHRLRDAGRTLAKRVAEDPRRAAVLALLLVTCVCVFVPLNPTMPNGNADDSWSLGLNEAVSRHLVFGDDIVFTFGPYLAVFTRAYHPGTDGLMLFASSFLAIMYWFALAQIAKTSRRYLPWVFVVALATLMFSRDALLMSYPLLVGVIYCRRSALPSVVFTAAMFSPFGVLVLVKGTLLPLCVLIAAIVCVQLALDRAWKVVAAAIVAPLVTMVVFWVGAGQPLWGLPFYTLATLRIAAGYTDAMSLPGETREVIMFLIAALLLVSGVLLDTGATPRQRRFLAGVFFVFLFVSFKAGFVRHDFPHAIICETALMIAMLLFVATAESAHRRGVLIVGLVAWLYIDSHEAKMSTAGLVANLQATYGSAIDGIKARVGGELEARFYDALRVVNRQYRAPKLAGSTDVYSFEQGALLAAGNRWSPRPTIQSYAVFSAFTAEKNREHLTGRAAPDNVLFKVQPIDHHLPALEDGASWPVLLARYRPVAASDGYVVLQTAAAPVAAELPTLASADHELGAQVAVPSSDVPVFAEIDVRSSLLGALASFAFKLPSLTILIHQADGREHTYRFIPSMGRLGFLLSPLVENDADFLALYATPRFGKPVAWFVIRPTGSQRWWRDSYRVTFKRVTGTATR